MTVTDEAVYPRLERGIPNDVYQAMNDLSSRSYLVRCDRGGGEDAGSTSAARSAGGLPPAPKAAATLSVAASCSSLRLVSSNMLSTAGARLAAVHSSCKYSGIISWSRMRLVRETLLTLAMRLTIIMVTGFIR